MDGTCLDETGRHRSLPRNSARLPRLLTGGSCRRSRFTGEDLECETWPRIGRMAYVKRILDDEQHAIAGLDAEVAAYPRVGF